jgi:hypothetical protein
MSLFSLNTDCANGTDRDADVLAAFRNKAEIDTTIKEGMSANEISDIVSDRLIKIIKEQLQKSEELKK